MTEETPPARNPDKYSDNVSKKAKQSTTLVNAFFRDAVQRARDRNGRFVAFEQEMFIGVSANTQ